MIRSIKIIYILIEYWNFRSNDVGNLQGVPAMDGKANSVEWVSREDQSSIMNGVLIRKNIYFEIL